jgi:hypothetical protein
MDLDDCSYVDLYAVIEGRARLNPSCEARQVDHEQAPVIQTNQRKGKKQVTSMVSGLKTPHPGNLPLINKGKMKFELNSSIYSDQHYASANKSLRRGYEVNRNQEKATSQHQSKGLVRITEKSRSDKADSNISSSHRTHGQNNTKSVDGSINSGSRYNTGDGHSFSNSTSSHDNSAEISRAPSSFVKSESRYRMGSLNAEVESKRAYRSQAHVDNVGCTSNALKHSIHEGSMPKSVTVRRNDLASSESKKKSFVSSGLNSTVRKRCSIDNGDISYTPTPESLHARCEDRKGNHSDISQHVAKIRSKSDLDDHLGSNCTKEKSRHTTLLDVKESQSQYKEYSVVMREDEAFEDRLASAARSTNRTNNSRVVNKKSDHSVLDRSRRDPSRESLKNHLRTRTKERSCSRSPRRRARSCDAMRSVNRSRSPELTQRVKMALDRSPKRNSSRSKDRLDMHVRIPIAGTKKDPKVHESLDKSSRSYNGMHEDTRAVEGKQSKAYTFDRLSKQGRSARSQSPLGNQRSLIPVRVRSSSRIVQQGSELSMHSETLDMKRHHKKNLSIGQRSSKELKCRSQSPLIDPRRRFIQLQQGVGKIRDGRSLSDRLNMSEKKSNGGRCKSTNNLSNHQLTSINNRSQSPTARKKI